ncbi:MAG: transglutaminase domain-containing protein [Methanoregula sp.]|nr:transglutaminase domain-containing protein [Methanoregula sp.]
MVKVDVQSGGEDTTVQGTQPISPLVLSTFHAWTQGLDTQASLCSIFSHIRDIPYSLVVPLNDSKKPQEQILLTGKGSCGSKHYLLAEMFRYMNIPVVYATFPFLWNDPDLDYPPDLRKLAATLPVAHHLACRVQIGCSWILVDATWDLPLAKAGFPVNEHWDGYSKTECAVKPLKSPVRTAFCRTATNEPCREKDGTDLNPVDGEKDHWEESDRGRYYSEKISLRSSEELVRIRQFSREFSSWLETVRTSV